MRFEKGSGYGFDMTHNNDVVFSFPQDVARLDEKIVDEEEDHFMVYGTIGNAAVGGSKVKITALRKCYINIFHK